MIFVYVVDGYADDVVGYDDVEGQDSRGFYVVARSSIEINDRCSSSDSKSCERGF